MGYCRIFQNAFVFLFSFFVVGVHGESCDSLENPYGLTLECEYTDTGLPHKIQQFWEHLGTDIAFFSGVGDVPIAYRVFVNKKSDKAIVIVNGRRETFDKYQEVIYDFYNLGYSVFVYDHRGQGHSGRVLASPQERLKGHVVAFENYVEDLKVFVDNIVLTSGNKKIFLFSHSMGGSISQHYLVNHSNVFAAAAFSAPMTRVDTGLPLGCVIAKTVSMFCSTCSTPDEEFRSIDEELEQNGLTHSKKRYFHLKNVFSQNPGLAIGAPTFGWVAEACRSADFLEKAAFGVISTPSLVLQSGLDTLVSPEAHHAYCQSLPAALVEDCGPFVSPQAHHEVYFEIDEYRIPALSRVLAFFEKWSGV